MGGVPPPQDCDWGERPMALLGDSIRATEFDAGLAVWDTGFSTNYVVFRLDQGQLVAESYFVYKDRSGRSHHHHVSRFLRRAP